MVTSFFPRPDAAGGGAVVMHGQLMALAARHQVTLVALGDAGPRGDAGLASAGVEVHRIPRPTSGPAAAARRVVLAGRWLAGDRPLRALAFCHDAEALGDFGVGFEQAAEVAAEAVLVGLLAGRHVPEAPRP